MDGKPYLKGLEDFGKAALEDLWDTLQKLFIEVKLYGIHFYFIFIYLDLETQ